MNHYEDKFNAYIQANPRQSLQLLLTVLFFVWMSSACDLGLILYLILAKIARVQWWLILAVGACMAVSIMMINVHSGRHLDAAKFMIESFRWNLGFWKLLITYSSSSAFLFLYKYMLSYVIGFPLLFAGILSAVDLIQDSPHKRKIIALQKGEHINEHKELTEKKIQTALKKLNDAEVDGTILGVSTYTGNPVVIPDAYINQIVLVLGTTGGGKP
jgi:hypothetical protein